MGRRLGAILLAVPLVLAGCILTDPYGYRPGLKLGAFEPLPVEEARDVLRRSLEQDTWCLSGSEWTKGCGKTSGLEIRTRAATFQRQEGSTRMTVRLRFDEPVDEFICFDRVWGCGADGPATVAGDDRKGWPLRAPDETGLRRLLRAYNSLVIAARDPGDFAARAAAWRARPAPLSAEVDRHRILAETAFREKDLPRAMLHYESALDADPTWPGGNFNLAILCGEAGAYGDAAFYMKRYLALVPDAKDATAAREKIVVWEDKAGRGAN